MLKDVFWARGRLVFVLCLLGAAAVALDIACDDGGNDPQGCNDSPPSCVVFEDVRSRVRAPSNVELFFSVQSCEGEPVVGLCEDRLVLNEDESPISVFESGLTRLPNRLGYHLRAMVLVDLSASVVAEHVDELRTALVEAIDELLTRAADSTHAPQIEIAVSAFATRTATLEEIAPSSSCRRRVTSAVSNRLVDLVPEDLATNLYGSVQEAATALSSGATYVDDRPIPKTALIVITDGTDTAAMATRDQAVAAIEGVDWAYTIGVGEELDDEELTALGPSGTAQASSFASLASSFSDISDALLDAASAFYILGYCSPKGRGTHEITVEIEGATGALDPVSFNANGFVPGCVPEQVGAPCAGTEESGELECGFIAGLSCGSCMASSSCDSEPSYCGEDNMCLPACVDMVCGVDNGVRCGSCEGETEVCRDETGTCEDVCEDRVCGLVEGMDCGTCPGATELCRDETGTCENVCAGRVCGTVEGVECGTCTGETEICEDELGLCDDVCADRSCGLVSGIDCGTCSGETEICDDEFGVCLDVCAERTCGTVEGIDCGSCEGETVTCNEELGACVDVCTTRACGMVGEIDCGTCAGATELCREPDGLCEDVCATRVCGVVDEIDCGTCTDPEVCDDESGACVTP